MRGRQQRKCRKRLNTIHPWLKLHSSSFVQIERLRDEGFRKIHEQEEILRRQLQAPPPEDNEDLLPTLKVTWRAKTSDRTNGGYSKESLTYLFSKVRQCIQLVYVTLSPSSSLGLYIMCWSPVRRVVKLWSPSNTPLIL